VAKKKYIKEFKNKNQFHEKYKKDGFYIFKNLLSDQAVKDIISLVLDNYSTLAKKEITQKNIFEFVYTCEKQQLYDELYSVYKKMADSTIMKELESQFIVLSKSLFNRNYKHLTRGFAIGVKDSKRTSYDWHQEQAYYPKIKETVHYQFPMINICNKLNGTMSILAGSHNEGFIEKTKDTTLHKKSVQILLPRNINKLKNIYKEIFINMNQNDVVIFNPKVIHKSNPTKSIRRKTRFAGIVRLEARL
jgi:hypothetical protein